MTLIIDLWPQNQIRSSLMWMGVPKKKFHKDIAAMPVHKKGRTDE